MIGPETADCYSDVSGPHETKDSTKPPEIQNDPPPARKHTQTLTGRIEGLLYDGRQPESVHVSAAADTHWRVREGQSSTRRGEERGWGRGRRSPGGLLTLRAE